MYQNKVRTRILESATSSARNNRTLVTFSDVTVFTASVPKDGIQSAGVETLYLIDLAVVIVVFVLFRCSQLVCTGTEWIGEIVLVIRISFCRSVWAK